jgi:hypothetical protein
LLVPCFGSTLRPETGLGGEGLLPKRQHSDLKKKKNTLEEAEEVLHDPSRRPIEEVANGVDSVLS